MIRIRIETLLNSVLTPLMMFIAIQCSSPKQDNAANSSLSNKNESELDEILVKMDELLTKAIVENKIPRSEEANGEIRWATKVNAEGLPAFDWTLGFFPGSCWYLYEHSGDEKWKKAALQFQEQIETFRHNKNSHDLGFVFYCSFGNGYRLSQENQFKEVLVDAGNSLITRFNENVGCIQSWDVDKGWQSERDWKFPVIIDNMMNLELLFELAVLTGDQKYHEVAISHANTTLANHFRKDNSSYHVIDYDPESGSIRKKNTAQGYTHESAWARGQAWGLYGFTVCYRYTKDEKYLNQAMRIADYFINHPNMPEDGIPYWDFDAPNIPDEPRDVSAAAITASALVELSEYTEGKYEDYLNTLMKSLASKRYRSPLNAGTNFILNHSVGSIPHGGEVDCPLSYADYYYIEALKRFKEMNQLNQKIALK